MDSTDRTWDPIPQTPTFPSLDAAPPAPQFAEHDRSANRRSRRRDLGGMIVVSAVSAVIASAAMVGLLAPNLAATKVITTTSTPATAIQVSATSGPAGSSGTATTAAASESDAIVAAVARVEPAVVTITTTITSNVGRRSATGTGVGTGIIYTTSGYILTNAHVVEGATSITVTLANGRDYPGTIVKTDSTHDLAVVKIDASDLTAATIGNSSGVKVGETVIAIGNPLGEYTDSVTTGVLSGVNRTITVADDLTGQPRTLTGLLQTDAAINAGNSGGPLLDLAGNVIGINAASASSAQGLGFAVPIDTAASLMADAQNAA